ncbi:protein phosphatase 2c (macronuclear) [Tetrahymena thermophila SB210]|uniref:Protein phosphatase 2c n=1 Tax=Tetrahymena thermophila (strain SB210) TaxID=312017 RepID=Q24BS9_TETTS|nr:protein phosphatase 2c [Tetrahymena thermophila SB210]EAS05229.2 protein phosphatase 2c [Tetrahymena thermophila SB210]|eukprot:XP_001025474.2 protein phosphatase 2c [Tetrahymena thermophila SB210]
MISFKSLGIKKQQTIEVANNSQNIQQQNYMKSISSPTQSTSNALLKKKIQAQPQGYGMSYNPSLLFEQFSHSKNINQSPASAKQSPQQHMGVPLSYLASQDKQVGITAQSYQQQQASLQQSEEKRSKSSGLQQKPSLKKSKTPQLTPQIAAIQFDETQRNKSQSHQAEQINSNQMQHQQEQLQLNQSQNQYQTQQQGSQQVGQVSNNNYLQQPQSKNAIKINLYSSNQLNPQNTITKNTSLNLFHRKSNSTQLNKNFIEQNCNQNTYLSDSIAGNTSNLHNSAILNNLNSAHQSSINNGGINNQSNSTKTKLKITNYQALQLVNNNQIDSTRNSANSNLNQSTVNLFNGNQYRSSKNGFLGSEQNSDLQTPKTMQKFFGQNQSGNTQNNNENQDFSAQNVTQKPEKFPNLNIANKPGHHRANSDKIYKQIHQTFKSQSQRVSKDSDSLNINHQSNAFNLENKRLSEGGEGGLIDNRTKDISNHLKQSYLQQYQQQLQQQQNQFQSQQQSHQLNQQSNPQYQNQNQNNSQVADTSSIQYLQRQIANNSQILYSTMSNQKGNETNDLDEAATTTANSHTNGSPLNKNSINTFASKIGFKEGQDIYNTDNPINSNINNSHNNNNSNTNNNSNINSNNSNGLYFQTSYPKQNSFRNSNKGLSLDSGSLPQSKLEFLKSSQMNQQQQQQQYQNQNGVSSSQQAQSSNGTQSLNSPSQQSSSYANQLHVKLGQNGQLHLYSNKTKKSLSTAGINNTIQSTNSTLETLRKQLTNTQSPIVQQAMASSNLLQHLQSSQVQSIKQRQSSPSSKPNLNNQQEVQQIQAQQSEANINSFKKTKENFNSQQGLFGLSQSQHIPLGHKKNALSLGSYQPNSLYNSSVHASQYLQQNQTPQKSLNNSVFQNNQHEIVSNFFVKSKPGSLPNKPIKTNQDSYIVFPLFCNSKQKFIFSVCDGHGTNGHLVSQFIKKKLPIHIETMLKLRNNDFEYQSVKQAITQAYLNTAQDLQESNIDTQFSGSTSVLLYLNQNRIWCANLGDSRAICAKTNKSEWNAVSLSIDQKPDNEKEKQRILSKGGRVEPYRDYCGNPLGPCRVWLKSENMPGLAMARSFGDQIAQSVGVISEPEVSSYEITDDDKFLVIASDGVWEFLSNEKVVSLVTPYYLKNDPEGACDKLIKESTAMWKKEDDVVDDITAIVVFLNKPSNDSNKSNMQDSIFASSLKRSQMMNDHS